MSYGRNEVALSRGRKLTVFSGTTGSATTEPQYGKGENSMILYFNVDSGSGTNSLKIQGRDFSKNWIDVYDINGNLMGISSATASQAKLIAGIPDVFRIVNTEDTAGATVTISYETFTL